MIACIILDSVVPTLFRRIGSLCVSFCYSPYHPLPRSPFCASLSLSLSLSFSLFLFLSRLPSPFSFSLFLSLSFSLFLSFTNSHRLSAKWTAPLGLSSGQLLCVRCDEEAILGVYLLLLLGVGVL